MTMSSDLTETECVAAVLQSLPRTCGTGRGIEGLVLDMRAQNLSVNFIVFFALRDVLYGRPWPSPAIAYADEVNSPDAEQVQSEQDSPDANSVPSEQDVDVVVLDNNEDEFPHRFKEESFDAVRWADIVAAVDATYPGLDVREWKKLLSAFLQNPKMSVKDAIGMITPPVKRRTHGMR